MHIKQMERNRQRPTLTVQLVQTILNKIFITIKYVLLGATLDESNDEKNM